MNEVIGQIHYFPWSIGSANETVDIIGTHVECPFYGSPVLSIVQGAELFISSRHEKFTPLGASFDTLQNKYTVFEAPHGILAHKHNSRSSLSLLYDKKYQTIEFQMIGAVKQQEEKVENALNGIVLGWSQFFDDLIENNHVQENSQGFYQSNQLPWKTINSKLCDLAGKEEEPRMALIIHIARKMEKNITDVVNGARKILLRTRKMLPAERLAEVDTTCVQWLVRQAGRTLAEKAAMNRHQLLGITREESFNTLENMVLKDFILRCEQECHRYIQTEVRDKFKENKKAQDVNKFKNLCTVLKTREQLENVAAPPPGFSPNYALQNDSRYRLIWKQYQRLIRQEDEEDRIWDWQSRLWSDIVRVLVNTRLHSRSKMEEILNSNLSVRKEQNLGSRVYAGCEPGPFVDKKECPDFVLEIVHSDQAEKHPVTRKLGRTGGHMFLVANSLNEDIRSRVIIIWAVHLASSENKLSWQALCESAQQNLKRHQSSLEDRQRRFPVLKGLVFASDIDNTRVDFYPETDVALMNVPIDQRRWVETLNKMEEVLDLLLDEFLGVLNV
ncbi:DUF2357 domain-containing protein [Maridesulfovibrio ferrireducens]|uniref:DUF2357 domain-containing protein n=1 Tax=Maridesulfovibrio ferrireducens TaxID=246191 RepID=UPI001A34A595|nr:DUF2357 domain-containing protein [Maridesulfovibrio ferrireducens]MBI9109948.1 DUF2357 domain-containing protein [Maridesulfovibrio ferrireducens]